MPDGTIRWQTGLHMRRPQGNRHDRGIQAHGSQTAQPPHRTTAPDPRRPGRRLDRRLARHRRVGGAERRSGPRPPRPQPPDAEGPEPRSRARALDSRPMSLRSEISRAIADARDRAAASGALSMPETRSSRRSASSVPPTPTMVTGPATRPCSWRRWRARRRSGSPRRSSSISSRPHRSAEVRRGAGLPQLPPRPGWVAAQVGPILDAGAGYGRGPRASRGGSTSSS